MKLAIFLGVLCTVCGVQTAVCEEQSWHPDEATTLAELSKAPGVRVKVESLFKPVDHPSATAIPVLDSARALSEVTILFFPGATLFSPAFFENFRGKFVSGSAQPAMFSSGLELYLDVCDASQMILARVPVVYSVVSDADASEQHFKIAFMITPEAMKYSYLEVIEIVPRSGAKVPRVVYLGTSPEKK